MKTAQVNTFWCNFHMCSPLPTCSLGSRRVSLLISVQIEAYLISVHPPGIKSSVCSVRHEQSIWLSRSWFTIWAILLKRDLPCSVTRFCCSVIVVNSYRLGGMVSFLHLFLYQMVYYRVESNNQSCLRFISMSFCMSLGGIVCWMSLLCWWPCPTCYFCWCTQENTSSLLWLCNWKELIIYFNPEKTQLICFLFT